MVFKFSFKKWGWSNCLRIFISKAIPETWSSWRYCKLGSLEIYFRFHEVVFGMPSWVMMMYYLKLVFKRFWFCVFFYSLTWNLLRGKYLICKCWGHLFFSSYPLFSNLNNLQMSLKVLILLVSVYYTIF